MSIKLRELTIGEDLMLAVEKEAGRIAAAARKAGSLDERDIAKLERITKTYQMLMANLRENLKHGVFGKLSNEELSDSVDGASDSTDTDDQSDQPFDK